MPSTWHFFEGVWTSVGLAKYRIRLTVKRTERKAFILSTLSAHPAAQRNLFNPFGSLSRKREIFTNISQLIKPFRTADQFPSPLKSEYTDVFTFSLLCCLFVSMFQRRYEIFTGNFFAKTNYELIFLKTENSEKLFPPNVLYFSVRSNDRYYQRNKQQKREA